MSWSAPMTAVSGAAFTAAQFNTNVRDNLLETSPAKASNANGSFFVSTGTNAIAERTLGHAEVDSPNGTTTSTTYTSTLTGAATGPSVSVTTGTRALVMIASRIENDTNASLSFASVAVSGATTIAANDNNAIYSEAITATVNLEHRFGNSEIYTLNAGVNTFTMNYRVTAGTAIYTRRHLVVIPF